MKHEEIPKYHNDKDRLTAIKAYKNTVINQSTSSWDDPGKKKKQTNTQLNRK